MGVGYQFGRGKNRRGLLGTCDRCGMTYRHSDLKPEYKIGRDTGLLVCPECWDPDHEQDWPPHLLGIEFGDPKPKENTRPDPTLEESREIPE